jgi:hypothetical protein
MSEREPQFWGPVDAEGCLTAEDENDAIEQILDAMDEPLPGRITIAGYALSQVKISPRGVLDNLLEQLDEDYANPEGDATEATEAMKEAERVFLEVITKEYQPWSCDEVCRKEIGIVEWLKENRPDWLTPPIATPEVPR